LTNEEFLEKYNPEKRSFISTETLYLIKCAKFIQFLIHNEVKLSYFTLFLKGCLETIFRAVVSNVLSTVPLLTLSIGKEARSVIY